MADFPQEAADFIAGLDDDDFINGGHRSNFIPANQAVRLLADYARLLGAELAALADQVETDAASAAAGSGTEATVDSIRAGTSAQYLSIRRVYEAAAPVALVYGATVAVDLSAGINFSLALAGDAQLLNPTEGLTPGKSGFIIVTQDATGGHELTRQANWKIAGGEIVLDQAPNARNVLSYFVESETSILVTVGEAFS